MSSVTCEIQCPAVDCEHEWEQRQEQGLFGLPGMIEFGCKKECGALMAAPPGFRQRSDGDWEIVDIGGADRPFVVRRR